MVTNTQRALWTFLIYALAGPFFAALALVIVVGLASVFGLSGLLPVEVPSLGQVGLAAFVWSTVPASLVALVLAIVVWRTGGISWIAAAAVAVIAFAASAVLLPLGLEDARPYLAFLAGIVSIVVREVLAQASIIAD
jgi:hypothetical protein